MNLRGFSPKISHLTHPAIKQKRVKENIGTKWVYMKDQLQQQQQQQITILEFSAYIYYLPHLSLTFLSFVYLSTEQIFSNVQENRTFTY